MSTAAGYAGLALPKGRTRKQVKAKQARSEAQVKRDVRAQCVKRDGRCRVDLWLGVMGDKRSEVLWYFCDGPSEHAHMHSHRRSQTRGQAPEQRHTTTHSLMLCRVHHQEYDAHRLHITALTRKGADGPLKFQRTP